MRRFKCRNGAVIEEVSIGHEVREESEDGGFSDSYRVVEWNGVPEIESANEWICLRLRFNGEFPQGGAHGSDWDIVEEVQG